jgi:hypothetical protein
VLGSSCAGWVYLRAPVLRVWAKRRMWSAWWLGVRAFVRAYVPPKWGAAPHESSPAHVTEHAWNLLKAG